MQVVIPDADLVPREGQAGHEELFKTQWSVTTWSEVLAAPLTPPRGEDNS
jgi:hypothetical protein